MCLTVSAFRILTHHIKLLQNMFKLMEIKRFININVVPNVTKTDIFILTYLLCKD